MGKANAAGASGFSQHLQEESVAGIAGMSGLAGVSAVGALIGIQEVEDATERAARGRKRGNQLLNQLDEMRLALLSCCVYRPWCKRGRFRWMMRDWRRCWTILNCGCALNSPNTGFSYIFAVACTLRDSPR
jgi:hypothetical protein